MTNKSAKMKIKFLQKFSATPINTHSVMHSQWVYSMMKYMYHCHWHCHIQGLDFDANQRIDSRRDSRHTIAARIKVDSRERYHDSKYLSLYFDHFFLVTNQEHSINKNVRNKFKRERKKETSLNNFPAFV